MQFSVSALEELPELARQLVPEIRKHRIVLFNAVMGTGKTTLIAELCRQLGCTTEASSPTYSLVNEYESADGIVCHFDLYRLKSMEEAMDIGFEDYLDSGNICLVEWPDVAMGLISQSCLEILITRENQRRTYTLTVL
ncbi:MAG: tRNA (adenosine(37)-N6)-threonylcarbamoyltransferase complex ATPase subunit type 1 TsaE [Bacteroidota bacterium]